MRSTLQRIVEYPERRGFASQVIWNGNDVDGFYTSHLATSIGRHTAPGPYGAATGKTYHSRTIADCMIYRNRVYREWLVRDNMGQLLALGVDPDTVATRMATENAARGMTAPQVMWHGPRMRDLYGRPAMTQQLMGLLAMIPHATWTPHHVCSVKKSSEGGMKIAVRWTLDGLHTGWGAMGSLTNKPLFVLGISQFHVVGGRIQEEFTLWDELALRVQVKLPPC